MKQNSLLEKRAARAHCVEDFWPLARGCLPRSIYDFFDGAAEDELALTRNRDRWRQITLGPKVLVDVKKVDLSCEIIGGHSPMPLAVAPTGGVGFGRHGGDIAIARAAATMGIPYTLSTSATASIEQIALAAPGRLWFQAYILSDKDELQRLIDRAFSADYEGLMITVDLPVGGKRERDLHHQLSFPLKFTPRNVLGFAARPAWALRMLTQGVPVMENLKEMQRRSASTVRKSTSSVGKHYDPSFNWNDLQKIRDGWKRKLIVKGVVRPDDAVRLVEMGIDAVIVSNHGGRQLDAAPATCDALPGIVRAVNGRVPVLVDGGIRRGVDVVKARAMGAQGVLVGRATLFGALAAGEPGAIRALEILQDEAARAMRLSGITRIEDIDSSLLFTSECGS
ncbi:alpha-hydroxy acid oxidase [Orrella marina]|uniref:Alpha-hydroxy-acid oxidizing protein n=1 Tax=Orrella marina TaxID=2163011 RepID=A0A2R4XG72_9BURK|nr:alpha-hydroxy acid oxidase [Orrella marina]AWB32791.1 alpha-hydroxy-acid oxidizing protein [Orrella marina]